MKEASRFVSTSFSARRSCRRWKRRPCDRPTRRFFHRYFGWRFSRCQPNPPARVTRKKTETLRAGQTLIILQEEFMKKTSVVLGMDAVAGFD